MRVFGQFGPTAPIGAASWRKKETYAVQTPPRGDSPLREDGKRSCLEQCFCGVKPPLQQEARASCGRAVPTRGCRTALCP